jgi:hypothetical protein
MINPTLHYGTNPGGSLAGLSNTSVANITKRLIQSIAYFG